MVKLLSSFSRLKTAKILILGDFMLDTYTTGKVDRISPEAPVPILHVQKYEDLPGGAGNVALNLQALGADVICVGRIGDDKDGERLKMLLGNEGIDINGLFVEKEYQTPVKNRLIANSQQLMRIDNEIISPLDLALEEKVISYISSHIDSIQVIAISDYGKGFLSRSLLKVVIDMANQKKIPSIVDPKGADFTKYQHATLIKPNQKEAYEASKLPSEASIDEVGNNLLQCTKSNLLMITRSELGITLFDNKMNRSDFPVKSHEVKDVTGAGDTILAVTALIFASDDLDIKEGLHIANIAAGIAIEGVGCIRVSLSDIAERLLKLDILNKVFDEEHLFALEQALINKNLTILGLSSEQGISAELFSQIQNLATRKEDDRLMIYVIDENPDEHFIALLSSLHVVDFIVIQSDSLFNLSRKIHPTKIFMLENKILFEVDHPDSLLTKMQV